MTADDATPALSPLRQQIAEAIHAEFRGFCGDHDEWDDVGNGPCSVAADAVVALLNLTEEEALLDTRDDEYLIYTGYGPGMTRRLARREGCSLATRFVTPWLPSTPPDTSSSEPA